jgi:hypothetical protein
MQRTRVFRAATAAVATALAAGGSTLLGGVALAASTNGTVANGSGGTVANGSGGTVANGNRSDGSAGYTTCIFGPPQPIGPGWTRRAYECDGVMGGGGGQY